MRRNKVLIPLDSSAFSQRILPVVRRFLRPEENELILLQVTEAPNGGTGGIHALVADQGRHDDTLLRFSPSQVEVAAHPIYTSQIEESVALRLEDQLSPIVDELRAAGYTVAIEISFGDPAQAIEERIWYNGIDLVAMTTHGRSGLPRAVVGSVAEHTLRHISVPILLLHSLDEEESGSA